MAKPIHSTGFPFAIEQQSDRSCGNCAWSHLRGPGPKKLRCVRAGYQRVAAQEPACLYWEDSLDCLEGGACCSEAYDAVEVSRTDPVRKKQPDWIVKVGRYYQVLRRKNNRCAALQENLHCSIYEDRPQCCRDFTKGSANCLFARRRLKISP